MILVISAPEDDHAVAVLEGLDQAGVAAVLLDLSQYPQHSHLTMRYDRSSARSFKLRQIDANTIIPLSSCRVAWWRRPQPVNLHPEVTDAAHRFFAHNEIHEAISGLWLALDAFWMNDPTRDEKASHKPYQLKIAQAVGLEIPVTCITSDPDEARAFVQEHGPERTIYKMFTATEDNWRETRLIKPEEIELLDSVRFAPVIFQEYVPAQLDLRITIVGDNLFAASVDTPRLSYHADYRMELGKAQVEPFELPMGIAQRLRAFMKQLGLVYGAIDMRLTPDGRFVFLEVNTAGQWLFIEERTGQPITEAVVSTLAAQVSHFSLHE
ncbi:MAG: alpha-L-glutamate ligase [Acidobacteria bacterium]|nr:alpha-L-glutamate ligase [Acidobacteriota bacterium]